MIATLPQSPYYYHSYYNFHNYVSYLSKGVSLLIVSGFSVVVVPVFKCCLEYPTIKIS